MKRIIIIICLLCFVCIPAWADTLRVGSNGDDVLAVKRRLYELNYIRTEKLTRQYTEDTATRIARFQQANGLPETGEVDDATAAVLFSADAMEAPHATMLPAATPAPVAQPDWPARDADGYLADAGEYFYENDQDGLWAYLSAELQITITRVCDSRIGLEWFETEIIARNDQQLRTVVTDREHLDKGFLLPEDVAQKNRFVLAFSDDFYGNRIVKKETVGVIIRNGQILSQKTNVRTGTHLPNLDMMAQFQDGTLRVYDCNECDAQTLLDQGAINVFSFGPWLIRDGKINELIYENFKSKEPRHALGMIEPGHYFVLSMEGRNSASTGTTLQRVAEIMRSKGVTQALNLDGGNTMAVVFHGKMLNQLAVYDGKKFVRKVPSMIGIGTYQ